MHASGIRESGFCTMITSSPLPHERQTRGKGATDDAPLANWTLVKDMFGLARHGLCAQQQCAIPSSNVPGDIATLETALY